MVFFVFTLFEAFSCFVFRLQTAKNLFLVSKHTFAEITNENLDEPPSEKIFLAGT